MPATARTMSTVSRPMATTSLMGYGRQRRFSASRNYGSPTCSGAAVEAGSAARSATRRPPWRPAWRIAWWRSVRWRRVSMLGAAGRSGAAAAVMGDDAFLFPHGVMSFKATLRHENHPFHARSRHQAVPVRHRTGLLPPRSVQPNAVMRGRELDEAKYDASRWIIEPFHHLMIAVRKTTVRRRWSSSRRIGRRT